MTAAHKWARLAHPRRHLSSRRGPSLSPSRPVSKRSATVLLVTSTVTTVGLWTLVAAGRDDIPRLDEKIPTGLAVEHGPDEEEVTRLLERGSFRHTGRQGSGILHYDGAQVNSNSPCEDRYTHGLFSSPWNNAECWYTWGVFDGHSGWQTAELLKQQLTPVVRQHLGRVKMEGVDGTPRVNDIQRAIMDGFIQLDNLIFDTAREARDSQNPLQDTIKCLAPAFAGSCALLSLFDAKTRMLHVACTGDSRAVLGRRIADSKWEAVALSADQNGRNQDEMTRIQREHPGEDAIARDGRMLGLAVSRAFGDSRWKLPLDMQREYQRRFYGPSPLTPRYDIRTPPYLTAEPVVTSITIEHDRPSFLIMASDGMWDTLSNEQAVELVGKWIDARDGRAAVQAPQNYGKFDFGQFWKGVSWRFIPARTTVRDDNAAVHLVRNALGGNHSELLHGRLAFDAPLSRKVRDDITVQVVFFSRDS
ncbi:phosphatase 2C-like domain-containing protein [Elsinoe ampelina]|uniref:Phosphatase 2C-like domain-containing protein n=1 Tax=Elsinoe ampelina TaxID=302913 RepID=A0A6A6G7A4_9PEZI|nr:phosphatase 2C-like domain-containing protein [Elsinoe ampelina]